VLVSVISTELDEILALSDRIGVMYKGAWLIFSRRTSGSGNDWIDDGRGEKSIKKGLIVLLVLRSEDFVKNRLQILSDQDIMSY